MATTIEYKNFILEQLDLLDNTTSKAMMGEYLLYNNKYVQKIINFFYFFYIYIIMI